MAPASALRCGDHRPQLRTMGENGRVRERIALRDERRRGPAEGKRIWCESARRSVPSAQSADRVCESRRNDYRMLVLRRPPCSHESVVDERSDENQERATSRALQLGESSLAAIGPPTLPPRAAARVARLGRASRPLHSRAKRECSSARGNVRAAVSSAPTDRSTAQPRGRACIAPWCRPRRV